MDGAASLDDSACVYGDSIESVREVGRVCEGVCSLSGFHLTIHCGHERTLEQEMMRRTGLGDLLLVCSGRSLPMTLSGPIGPDRAAACPFWGFVLAFLVLQGLWSTRHRDPSSKRHRCSQQRLVAALRTAGDVYTHPLLHPLRHSLAGSNGRGGRVSQGVPTLP